MQTPPIAAYGLMQAVARFDASAQRTARAGDASAKVELVDEAVEQIGAEQAVMGNLAVLRTADDMTRRLLDIMV